MGTRVLIVDDHRMMRDGLKLILDQSPDMEVVAEAGDGHAAVELARTHKPDVVIMDVGMAEMNGIEATRQIISENPKTKVVALSTYGETRYVVAMLDAGASGYVLKVNASDELARTIHAVLQGQIYLPAEVAGTVVNVAKSKQWAGDKSAYVILGAREREVLQLLAEGKSSKDIAHKMHISFRTVEAHRRNLMQKIGLRSVAELTKYAVREGITQIES